MTAQPWSQPFFNQIQRPSIWFTFWANICSLIKVTCLSPFYTSKIAVIETCKRTMYNGSMCDFEEPICHALASKVLKGKIFEPAVPLHSFQTWTQKISSAKDYTWYPAVSKSISILSICPVTIKYITRKECDQLRYWIWKTRFWFTHLLIDDELCHSFFNYNLLL